MKHTVYKTTNNSNGMYYIGVHSIEDTEDPNDRYLGSGTNITKAIRREGKENFTKEVLGVYPTRREALEAEAILVDHKDLMSYNMIPGGQELLEWNEELKKEWRKRGKDQYRSKEARKEAGMYGRKAWTEEFRKYMVKESRERSLGLLECPEYREKQRIGNLKGSITSVRKLMEKDLEFFRSFKRVLEERYDCRSLKEFSELVMEKGLKITIQPVKRTFTIDGEKFEICSC